MWSGKIAAYPSCSTFDEICFLISNNKGREDTGPEQVEKKEVIIENPVTVGGVTLIPVAQVSLTYKHSNNGISVTCVNQPIAIVVLSVSARKAFRITGEEISINQLIQEIPNIKPMMEGM